MKVYVLSIELDYEGRCSDVFVYDAKRSLEDIIKSFCDANPYHEFDIKDLKCLSDTLWEIKDRKRFSHHLVIELEEVR